MSLPSRKIRPAVGLHQAHDRVEAGGLAGAVGSEQPDDLAAMNVEADVVQNRPLVVGLGDRADLEPVVARSRLGGWARDRRGFVHRFIAAALRDGEVASDAPPAGIHARRAAVDHRSPGVQVDHQPGAIYPILLLDQLHVADQRDELPVEIVDSEIALRGLRRALHHHTAGRIQPLNLRISAGPLCTRIGDGKARSVERHLSLDDVNIAAENGAVGAILHFDPVRVHVHRRIGVVPLERGDRRLLLHLRERGRGGESRRCKDDANGAHAHHLTAPCMIFKRAPPSSTTV